MINQNNNCYLYFLYFVNEPFVKVGMSYNVIGRVCSINRKIDRRKCHIFEGDAHFVALAEKLILLKFKKPAEQPENLPKSKEYIFRSELKKAMKSMRRICEVFELNEITENKNYYLTPKLGNITRICI